MKTNLPNESLSWTICSPSSLCIVQKTVPLLRGCWFFLLWWTRTNIFCWSGTISAPPVQWCLSSTDNFQIFPPVSVQFPTWLSIGSQTSFRTSIHKLSNWTHNKSVLSGVLSNVSTLHWCSSLWYGKAWGSWNLIKNYSIHSFVHKERNWHLCCCYQVLHGLCQTLFFYDWEVVFVCILDGWVVVSHDFKFLKFMVQSTNDKYFSRFCLRMFQCVFDNFHDLSRWSISSKLSMINLHKIKNTSSSRTSRIINMFSLHSLSEPIC